MKKSHIIAFIAIVAAVSIIVIGSKDVTTYGDFSMAENAPGSVKIAGTLDLNKPIHFDIEEDPNSFSFYMNDKANNRKKVIVSMAKPQDFEQSESIVVTGKLKGDTFYAHDILLKCPSKYKDEEIRLRAGLDKEKVG